MMLMQEEVVLFFKKFTILYLISIVRLSRTAVSSMLGKINWRLLILVLESLFKSILSCVGRKASNGQRKGGIKVHPQISLHENLPNFVWLSAATVHDKHFLKHIKIEPGKIAVFDKGYNDYKTFDEFTTSGVFFVTRLK